jgi:hypothetical protein
MRTRFDPPIQAASRPSQPHAGLLAVDNARETPALLVSAMRLAIVSVSTGRREVSFWVVPPRSDPGCMFGAECH